MGAVTVVIDRKRSRKDLGYITADVTFSGTYAAGGDTYTLPQFEMLRIDAIVDGGTAGSTTTAYNLLPDLTNLKLRLIGGAASGVAGAETATANQTGTVAHVLVLGVPVL